jgi:uncharacterized protein (DUF2249 family)
MVQEKRSAGSFIVEQDQRGDGVLLVEVGMNLGHTMDGKLHEGWLMTRLDDHYLTGLRVLLEPEVSQWGTPKDNLRLYVALALLAQNDLRTLVPLADTM